MSANLLFRRASVVLLGGMLGLAGCAERQYRALEGAPDGQAELLSVSSDENVEIAHVAGTFLELTGQEDRVVLVDFWGPHCGPCLQLAPVLEEIAREYATEVAVVKVDLQSAVNAELGLYFQVHGIPEMRLFVNGRSAGALHGYMSASRISAALDAVIADRKQSPGA